MSEWLQYIHDLFVYGALEKGWGGPKCRKAVPIQTHLIESLCWLICCAFIYFVFNMNQRYKILVKNIKEDLQLNKTSVWLRRLEIFMSMVHFGMFLQILCYKIIISSLINMFQPCHVILLLQGIALYSDGVLGILITIFILPALTGTMLAMLFPDVGGLDLCFEIESYWFQHILIQAMPIYLLSRRNFTPLKYCLWSSSLFGLWILAILHFAFFEIIDLSLNVNVEFMLCPTDAMVSIFANLPPWVLLPSYRTTLTFTVIVVGILMSLIYIFIAKLLKSIFETKSKSKDH